MIFFISGKDDCYYAYDSSFMISICEFLSRFKSKLSNNGALDYGEIFVHTLDIAKLFTSIEFKSPSPWFGCSFVQWTWWALQNLMFQGKVCSIWWFNFEYLFVDILLTSLASGADDWPSRAIASKQTTNVKKRRSNF